MDARRDPLDAHNGRRHRGPVLSSSLGPASAALVLALGTLATSAESQETWNGPRAMALVERARTMRQSTTGVGGLESYAADARGYLYFFLHHEASGDRNLVKTDQVALQVFWEAPARTKQIIVGQRDEEELPTNIHYHLDHLTVVQDDFGDLIRMGDGDEVSDVVHPLAPGSASVYDFLLGDSLTIRFAGASEPIRVYEVQVRPRDAGSPGFIGSVFVDRTTAAVVRMRFTFTPASYVDPFLDYIRVSLDNGLWDGRYWLPYQQEVEIRREAPFFDFPMGSVIRGRFDVRNYRLNEPLPSDLFVGGRVSAVSPEARAAFEFERGLHDEIADEGLGPAPELDEIREQAAALARNQYLSGLGPLRPYVPGVSAMLRVNRAEGVFVGAGLSYTMPVGLRLLAHGGYGFGREEGQIRVDVMSGERRRASSIAGYLNEPRDIGPIPAASGAVNSLAVLLRTRDFQDLYFTSGVEGRHRVAPGDDFSLDVSARWERHRAAFDVLSDSTGAVFRPVRKADEGDVFALAAQAEWKPRGPLDAEASLTLATFEGSPFATLRAGLAWSRSWERGRGHARLAGQAGMTTLDAPAQNRFLLGGRGTLPGYAIRSLAGDRFWMARGDAGVAAAWPWLGWRVFVAAGGTGSAGDLPSTWIDASDASLRVSAGVGVDLLWDVLRLELGRGLSTGGGWEINLFASSRFWPVL